MITGGADASIQFWPNVLGPSQSLNEEPSDDCSEIVTATVPLLRWSFEQDTIRCIATSRISSNTLYLFTDKGRILICKIQDFQSLSLTNEFKHQNGNNSNHSILYEQKSFSGSYTSCNILKFCLGDENSIDVLVGGHSKGFVSLLFVNREGNRAFLIVEISI